MAGYIPRWFTRSHTVTHPSTNRAWRGVTSLIETNALPLSHATNKTKSTKMEMETIPLYGPVGSDLKSTVSLKSEAWLTILPSSDHTLASPQCVTAASVNPRRHAIINFERRVAQRTSWRRHQASASGGGVTITLAPITKTTLNPVDSTSTARRPAITR